MKVLHLNSSDRSGGAAQAAWRLHSGLLAGGVESELLVRTKSLPDGRVTTISRRPDRMVDRVRPYLDRLPVKFYRHRQTDTFSPDFIPDRVAGAVARINPDLVHLHWVAGGFLRIESLARFRAPQVWTLHDMWPFTGGCHYSGGCDRYRHQCGCCPLLGSTRERDLSRRVWSRKARSWNSAKMTVVAPSQWLGACARQSSLFANVRVEVIPNGIDTRQFRPHDRSAARRELGLPLERRLVLFGALHPDSDERKGGRECYAALERFALQNAPPPTSLLILGGMESDPPISLPFPVHRLGRQDDPELLARIYSAADVFVAPSREENLSNMVMEALACGTPVLAFAVGGMPDMIRHQETGFLARPLEIADLVAGLTWLLADGDRLRRQGKRAREQVLAAFALERIAGRYAALYQELLGGG